MTEKQRTIEYYNKHSKDYIESSLNVDMHILCDAFLKYLSVNALILDLGCGSGRDSLYFLQRGYSVVSVDGSEKMCQATTTLTCQNARKLQFDELDYQNEFDGIWACASLLHVPMEELPMVLSKVVQALKPQGILYMSFKYGKFTGKKSGRFFSYMTETEARMLCSSEKQLNLLATSITEDVRPERESERWINIFAQRI